MLSVHRLNYIIHFIYSSFQHFSYRYFIVLFQETETSPICAWGMEKGITQNFGNPFGEFCCTHTYKSQLALTMDAMQRFTECANGLGLKEQGCLLIPTVLHIARRTIDNVEITLKATTSLEKSYSYISSSDHIQKCDSAIAEQRYISGAQQCGTKLWRREQPSNTQFDG